MAKDGIYMKSNKEKHILILTPGFPKDHADTTCIPALQTYLRTLSSIERLKISIISFQYPYTKEEYSWNKINVYPANGQNRKGIFRLFTWGLVFFKFLKINRINRVDIVHSFWYAECAFLGSIISVMSNVLHVSTFMGQDALSKNKFARLMIKKPFVVSLSKFHERNIWENLGISSDEIIPWGIDKREFVNEPEKDRPIDVLGVGSLIPLKNYSLFIEIIHELVKKGNSLKCVILGAGPELESLNDKIVEYDLMGTLELKGEVDRPAVIDYMKQSKVLLHTSDYESFGMVFIEALQSGVKIVSKPVGCFEESDIWMVGENKKQLQDALLKMLDSNNQSDLSFDIQNTVERYLKVYDSLKL